MASTHLNDYLVQAERRRRPLPPLYGAVYGAAATVAA